MSIQEEIHKAMKDLQNRMGKGHTLDDRDMSLLLLTSLIEEEGENAGK